MSPEQKIEERKKWNVPFLRAFNYLMDEGYASTKGELCNKIGIEPGLISRYNNGTKKVSVDTMNALARVSEGKLNVQYMLGKSEYMLLENVPDDEIIGMHNPDREVIEKRKSKQMHQSVPSHENLLELYAQRIRLVDDLRTTLKEELAEVRNMRIELQEARDAFRDVTYRLSILLQNSNLEQPPLMAAEN